MTDDEKLMQQALEALKDTHYRIIGAGLLDQDLLDRNFTVATALRERLAQPAQQEEPVAVHQFRKAYCSDWYDGRPDHTDGGGPYEERTLYTAPPQRKPLTIAQIDRAANNIITDDPVQWWRQFARVVEAAHGIKVDA